MSSIASDVLSAISVDRHVVRGGVCANRFETYGRLLKKPGIITSQSIFALWLTLKPLTPDISHLTAVWVRIDGNIPGKPQQKGDDTTLIEDPQDELLT